ncbi:MAG TPA: serine hydrolase domain-containing protein [Flavobacteriaceae bacterium]|nr:serine hydrolase domain-containing protein [Flavobacteriaceae bacterium]
MKKQILLYFLSYLCFTGALAQNKELKDLNLLFDKLEEHNQFMGSVQLIQNDSILYERSLGYSNIEMDKKASSKTHYAIGSITKTYTATLILMAIEESKMDLDSTLDNFYPNLYNADKISIKNLLQHRSGIPNITNEFDYLEWNTKEQTREDMLERIEKYTSAFEPGSHFAYSNSNYILLTYILEDLYKKDYASILQEKILEPLNLNETYFGYPSNKSLDVAASYLYQDAWTEQPKTHYSVPLGAGAIFSTVSDLNKFANHLFSGNILSPASMQEMLDTKDSFGLGIITFPFHEIIGYGHSGGIDGFQSFFGYLPYEKIGYSILSNGTRFSLNDMGVSILQAATGKGEVTIPTFDACQLTEADQEQYIGVYSSNQIPLKITVRKSDRGLSVQATGQPSLELHCEDEPHTFTYKMAGLKMVFIPEEDSFRLLQGGGNFLFVKE